MTVKTYLKNFFDEKEIQFQSWEIENDNGVNFIDSDFVINYIKNGLTLRDQEKVVSKLRELDYYNAPIEPFLEYLAKGLVG